MNRGAIAGAAIEKASKIMGSEIALAAAMGVSRQKLNYWKNTSVPYEMAIVIYLVTDGKVDIDELRPDQKVVMRKFKKQLLQDFAFDAKTKALLISFKAIKVKRYRKDYGDMQRLINSIAKAGLHNPIVVNHKMELVSGERRWVALKKLKYKYIPVIVRDEATPIMGRFFDNFFQKPYTQEEQIRIQKKLNRFLKQMQGNWSSCHVSCLSN